MRPPGHILDRRQVHRLAAEHLQAHLKFKDYNGETLGPGPLVVVARRRLADHDDRAVARYRKAAPAHAQGCGDLLHREAATTESAHDATGPWLCPASAAIDAPLFRHRDPRRLPLPSILRLDLRPTRTARSPPPAPRPAQVDLPGHGHPPDPPLAPVGQQVHAVTLTMGEPVQLPDHHRLDRPGEDGLLQPIEGRMPLGPPGSAR